MWLLLSLLVAGDVLTFPGGKVLPHEKYINVVSEADSPVERIYVKSKDGVYVAAAMRKPKGAGPFPVLVHFHGAPGGRGIEQLVTWVRGDTGSPVYERFLQEGYAVVVADYRAVNLATLWELPSPDAVTYADDAVAVIEHVRKLPGVDASRIHVYGVSLGGEVMMQLLARTSVRAAILGAGAPLRFLGVRPNLSAPRQDWFRDATADEARATANVDKIQTPILILVGAADSLLPVNRLLHDRLEKAGKRVRMEVYENGYHDFVMGPNGQNRPDLKEGAVLLDVALQALESTLKFLEQPPR